MSKNQNGPSAAGTMDEFGKTLKNLVESEQRATQGWGKATRNLSEILSDIESILTPFSKVHKAATDLAKAIGMTSAGIMNTATRIVRQNKAMDLSMNYNISNDQMLQLQGKIFNSLGRNVAIDMVGTQREGNQNFDSSLENLVAARTVFGDEAVAELVGGFDKLGISMKTAAKATGKLFKEAGEYGINLDKYVENFTSNLSMAQMYNFRNGVNGLKEMARKATEIRQDMKQIASFADKVGSVTGAVETAANLQVLGGSFAAMSNPLAMLNESLTDMNGLQDRFNKMTAGAARYNSVTHEIEMDPVTRQIMKRAAESMGVDPANLIDQAYAQARKGEIERQIDVNGIGGIDDNLKTLLSNVGEIDSETGVAGATIDGKFRTLAEIAGDTKLQDKLVEETRSESEDIKEIAKSVLSIEDIVSGRKYQLETEEAMNKISEGSIGENKISTWDQAVDILLDTFNKKTIEGAGNLAKAENDFKVFLDLVREDLAARVYRPFSENTPEGLGTAMSQELTDVLGESDIAKKISDEVGKIATSAAQIVKDINERYAKPNGYDMLRFTENGEMEEGMAGRANPLTASDRPEDMRFAMSARDVMLEGNNVTIGGSQLFTPVQDNGQIARATATITNGGEMTDLLAQYIEDLADSLGIEIEPVTQEGQGGTVITGNDNSIPSVTVQGTNPQTYTAQNGTEVTGTRTIDYNLNLSGVLTMNVNGDNGRIGTIDLMKMLQKDDGLKRELSKVLSDAVKRIKEIGLNEGD